MANNVSTPPTPAQVRREREIKERREAILDAARDVFFAKGLHSATVDDVAAQAQIAKGTVYLYFSSKEELVAGLLLRGLDLLVESLGRAYDEGADLTAETRLRNLALAYLTFSREQPDYFRLIMAFDRGQFQESISPELYSSIFDRSLAGLRWIIRAMEQGIDDKEFGPGSARGRAGMMWAALNGVLVLFGHPLRRALLETELEPLYRGVLDMILRDLQATA
ncbi:MAG: TetR/AcrR family transcriptional regulator [Anaerolineales bacterium]